MSGRAVVQQQVLSLLNNYKKGAGTRDKMHPELQEKIKNLVTDGTISVIISLSNLKQVEELVEYLESSNRAEIGSILWEI